MNPRIGSLFSGAGGLDLAVESVFGGETVWHSEVDPAASKVLAHRWPGVPNLGDIKEINWNALRFHIDDIARVSLKPDVICGGFPCQDVSAAGKRAGLKHGTRTGLFAELMKAVEALRPKMVVLENVMGLFTADGDEWPDEVTALFQEAERWERIMLLIEAKKTKAERKGNRDREWWHRKQAEGIRASRRYKVAVAGFRRERLRLVPRAFATVLGALAEARYDTQWCCVSAGEIGAPHRRERVFILAQSRDMEPDSAAADNRVSMGGRTIRRGGLHQFTTEPLQEDADAWVGDDGPRRGAEVRRHDWSRSDQWAVPTEGVGNETDVALVDVCERWSGGGAESSLAGIRESPACPCCGSDDHADAGESSASESRILASDTDGGRRRGWNHGSNGLGEGLLASDTERGEWAGERFPRRNGAAHTAVGCHSVAPADSGGGRLEECSQFDSGPVESRFEASQWYDSHRRGDTAADSSGDGRHEGRPEPARQLGGFDAAFGGAGPVDLLPTPAACNPNDGETPETWLARRERVKLTANNGNGMGMPLSIAVQLLPTPTSRDHKGPNQRQDDTCLHGALLPTPRARGDADNNPSGHQRHSPGIEAVTYHFPNQQWGKYGPAIARWEALTRAAPSPTEPNTKGNPRLNPAFSEWMMGWPEGWVTQVPGISRNDRLRIVGNGVCPQQAVAALRYLLAVCSDENPGACSEQARDATD